jgi:hypothetical protein
MVGGLLTVIPVPDSEFGGKVGPFVSHRFHAAENEGNELFSRKVLQIERLGKIVSR